MTTSRFPVSLLLPLLKPTHATTRILCKAFHHAPESSKEPALITHHHVLPTRNLDDIAGDSQEEGPPTKRPSYFCDICNSSFTKKSSFKRHLDSQGHLEQLGRTASSSYQCSAFTVPEASHVLTSSNGM